MILVKESREMKSKMTIGQHDAHRFRIFLWMDNTRQHLTVSKIGSFRAEIKDRYDQDNSGMEVKRANRRPWFQKDNYSQLLGNAGLV